MEPKSCIGELYCNPKAKFSKHSEAWSKLKKKLKKCKWFLGEAIEKIYNKVRVEEVLTCCKERLTAAIAKNDDLLHLVKRTEEKEKRLTKLSNS